MTISEIFTPGLREHYLEKLDERSLIGLSGVNKFFYQLLNNDFFKELFDKRNPDLRQLVPLLFREISTFHPLNFWKMASIDIAIHGDFNTSFSIYRIANTELFREQTHPLLIANLQNTRAEAEAKLKSLVGAGYADPSSPIDIAWKAFEKSRNEYKSHKDQLIKDIETLSLDRVNLLGPQHKRVFSILMALPETLNEAPPKIAIDFLINTLESTNFSDEPLPEIHQEATGDMFRGARVRQEGEIYWNLFGAIRLREVEKGASDEESYSITAKKMGIPEELISQALKLNFQIDAFRELFVKLRNEEKETKSFYEQMEKMRLKASRSTKLLECPFKAQEIKYLITESCLETYYECLKRAIDYKDEIHKRWKFIDFSKLINLSINKGLSPIDAENIRNYVNSLPSPGEIWGTLYHRCSGGIIEDRWAELHFHGFLPELLDIVIQSLSLSLVSDDWTLASDSTKSPGLLGVMLSHIPSYAKKFMDGRSNLEERKARHSVFVTILSLITQAQQRGLSEGDRQQILNLVDSSHLDVEIWWDLYEKCANEVLGDPNEIVEWREMLEWSQEHFHEFLGPLFEIVSQRTRNLEQTLILK